jgi:hypothetical protein
MKPRRAMIWLAGVVALASVAYVVLAAVVFFWWRGWGRPAPCFQLIDGQVYHAWGSERLRLRGPFEEAVDAVLRPGTDLVLRLTRRRCDDPRARAAFDRCLGYAGLQDDRAITATADQSLDSIEVTFAGGRTWCFVPDGPADSERPIDGRSLGATGRAPLAP